MLSPGIFMIAAILLSGNILMGFVTSRLAMRKGYLIGGFLLGKYFLTGFLLGVIGLIYVGFLPEEEEQFEAKVGRAIVEALAYANTHDAGAYSEERESIARIARENTQGYYFDEDAPETRRRRPRSNMENRVET